MPSEKRARRELAQELEDKRQAQTRLLKKVGKARAKFQGRVSKLQALEARIARLERRSESLKSGPSGQSNAAGNLRSVRLIYNPKSGGASKQLDMLVESLRAHGIQAEVVLKTSGKASRELAKEAAQRGDELVIVAAGDGTIEEVASQLVGTKTALGILPIGTMNNLARVLGIPLELDDACALLGTGITRPIDMGRVIANAKPDVEYFLETAGAGLSAIAIPAGQAAEKKRWGHLPSAIRKIFDSRPRPITVEIDGGDIIPAHAQVVTVSNAPMMGNHILLAPDAKMDDGLLDIAIYEEMSKADLLGYFLAAQNGQRAENPRVKFFRGHRVRIISDTPLEAHSDKDPIESQDILEIEVIPHALSMIVGQGVGLSLPVQTVASVPPLAGPQPAQADQAKNEAQTG